MDIDILGTPFNGIKTASGFENPPDGVRLAGLVPLLQAAGHAVNDLGNLTGFQFQDGVDVETGVRDLDQWIDFSNALSARMQPILQRDTFPLLLGGDCSMLVGIFDALQTRGEKAGLIFLDGHADFHIPSAANICDPADTELAVLTGRGPDRITRISGKNSLLEDENIVVYGLRSWDEIAGSCIQVFDKQRMDRMGIGTAVEEGLRKFKRDSIPFWLHFDVDVLDPDLMPVMFPEPDGLTFEEAKEFLSFVMASGEVSGMSVACYHPSLDPNGCSGKRLVALLSEILSE